MAYGLLPSNTCPSRQALAHSILYSAFRFYRSSHMPSSAGNRWVDYGVVACNLVAVLPYNGSALTAGVDFCRTSSGMIARVPGGRYTFSLITPAFTLRIQSGRRGSGCSHTTCKLTPSKAITPSAAMNSPSDDSFCNSAEVNDRV